MTQNSVKKALHAILKPIGHGLIIFAVFGFGLYAYAIVYPPQPGPVSGVVGMFVGYSPSGYDATVGSYQNFNDKCNSYTDYLTNGLVANSNAHACTPDEILNTYNNQPTLINQVTGAGILNVGPGSYIVYSNDCGGWKIRTQNYLGTAAYGTVWNFTGDEGTLQRCDILAGNTDIFKIACCQ